MKKLILMLPVFLLFALNAISAVGIDQFQKANQLYREGKYPEAVSLYEQMVDQEKSAEVYYNLGNAYFKQDKIGPAILNYERARNLKPRDRDILGNLDHARQLIEYKIEDKRNWYSRKISQILGYFTFEECMLLSFLAYFVLIVSFLSSLIFRKHRLFGRIGSALAVLFVFSSIPLLVKQLEFGAGKRGVVTIEQAEVRYGPSAGDRIAFRLTEGLEANLDDEKDEWYRIRLRDGRSGWTQKSQLTAI